MTEKEADLLGMFRLLDRYEQNIITGNISELILNKKKESSIFLEMKKFNIFLLSLYLFYKFLFSSILLMENK